MLKLEWRILSKAQLKKIIEAVGICENCGETDIKKLVPHRIQRGCDGGLYVLRNIAVICGKCHRQIHWGEFHAHGRTD